MSSSPVLRLCAGALFAVSCFLCGPGSASAADLDWMKGIGRTVEPSSGPGGRHYGMLKLGAFFPDISGTGTGADMKVGSGIETGYGYQPAKYFAAEASVGYLQSDDYDDNLENYHATIQIVPALATLRFILPLKYLELYAMGGGGYYYTFLKYDNVNIDGYPSESRQKGLWGYHYGGGAALPLGGASSLGIELRRIETSWENLDIGGTFVTGFMRLGF